MSTSSVRYLIPRPLLPGEKGRKNNKINVLAPLPWERGWGEVKNKKDKKYSDN
jgi:hypothetical protein